MTVTTVNDDQKRVPTLEEIGMFANRTHELFFRMKKGLLSPELVLDGIQQLSEGNVIVEEQKIIEQPQAVPTNRLKKLDLGNVSVTAMPRMKTKDCLKGGRGIASRDGNFDNWLSDYIPAIGGGSLGGFELTNKDGTTYRQMAESLLGTTSSDDELKKLLKERGHTFHIEQLADLLRRTKAGEKTGLIDNGYANLLFIEDDNGEVFGCGAHWNGVWYGYGWHVYVNRFGSDGRWFAGRRFFSRNKV